MQHALTSKIPFKALVPIGFVHHDAMFTSSWQSDLIPHLFLEICVSFPLPKNSNFHTLSPNMPILLLSLIKCADSVQFSYLFRILFLRMIALPNSHDMGNSFEKRIALGLTLPL